MFTIDIRGTVYTAKTLAGISAAYCKARDESGEGASTFPFVAVTIMDRGIQRKVGRFSYNGRVWPDVEWQDGVSPLYDPAADPVPAMLAALQDAEDRISEVIEDDPDASMFKTTRKAIRAAVKKAESART